ncbi:MAG: annexin [archaeon]|nr:annexin [archaeon]
MDIEKDIDDLKNAIVGLGTKEDVLIKIIANRNNEQRQELKKAYKTSFGRDLIEDIKGDTSGNFRKTLLALFETPIDFDCIELYNAMHRLGTDEDTLIEIIGTRSTEQLKKIIIRYKELYNRSLEDHVISETSGSFQKMLVSLLQCQRRETNDPNEKEMENYAQQLYDAGEGRRGTDESVFNNILANCSQKELILISRYYQQISKSNIIRAIDKEFSGDVKKLFKAIIYSLVSPSEFFATRIHDSIEGLGTDDPKLIRAIVSRSEIDLPQIKSFYYQLFKVSMVDDITGDTSGHYRELLLALVKK